MPSTTTRMKSRIWRSRLGTTLSKTQGRQRRLSKIWFISKVKTNLTITWILQSNRANRKRVKKNLSTKTLTRTNCKTNMSRTFWRNSIKLGLSVSRFWTTLIHLSCIREEMTVSTKMRAWMKERRAKKKTARTANSISLMKMESLTWIT